VPAVKFYNFISLQKTLLTAA